MTYLKKSMILGFVAVSFLFRAGTAQAIPIPTIGAELATQIDQLTKHIDELKKVNEARLCAHYWRQKAFAMYSALCQATGQYQELMNEDDIFPWEEPNLEDFKDSGEITTVDWDKVESEKYDADRD